MANNQANIKAVITAEDKASAVIKNFGNKVDDTSKDIKTSLNTSAIAVAAASAGIVAFGKKSLDAFMSQELASVRLQTGINNVKSATDKNIDSLLKQASALQKNTRFSDEAYISAQGILSTFQLNQKAIAALTPRLADMSEGLARVSGEMPDLEGNAIMVAKAIGGEDVNGLTGVLRKAGVVMTQMQTELLKTGTVEQRVALITEVLDQNFAHMAETAGTTTAGKLAILKNQFGELQEKVGQTIAVALNPMLNVLNAHPAVLTAVTIALGSLAVAFVGVKVAAAIGTTIQGVTVALGVMSGAATTATAALSTLSLVSVAGWAALVVADLYLVKRAVDAIRGSIDALRGEQEAAVAAARSNEAVFNRVYALQNSANADQRLRASEYLRQTGQAGFASGGFTGTGSPNDIAGVVHKGEYVLPQSQVNQSTGLPKSVANSTVNINVNVGALMGSDVEARKFAMLIKKHMDDAAGRSMAMGY